MTTFSSPLPSPIPLRACWSIKYRNYQIQRAYILHLAADILGGEIIARKWFESPARGLDSISPCRAVALTSGYIEVQRLLKRIDYGIYV
ncbi:antitoxin Xre/MbcA/ParS toxin-binding domain-containing protein [Pseudomonas oryzihabitans]|uniref:antitoxin Xre/MbcA/ParS toxin-binding domain-containing protein n=1 Tax=Pseudomonas oryzihabitans TaxID=47885 RepID=UPI003F5911B8